jgi:hypothetical protein
MERIKNWVLLTNVSVTETEEKQNVLHFRGRK